MKIFGVIPARIGSTRLPRKALVKIGGKPLIQWVYEGAVQYPYFEKLIVATDAQEIFDAVKGFGGDVVMTSPEHTSGSSRVYEAIQKYNLEDEDIVVNIQGDEPLINKKVLETLISTDFKNQKKYGISTVGREFVDKKEKKTLHNVKIVLNKKGSVLDFTRKWSPQKDTSVLCHIGLYAYKKWALHKFMELKPTQRERQEKLEQLRFCDDLSIFSVSLTREKLIGVDTKDDLILVKKEIEKAHDKSSIKN
ncbi:MAG: 3-deoxy-manno-octulosonate cytidylyltransferase [Deltaproteobacteria bacterium]|nr:3-deoxy-manno-octulosonate cytidylyltransferase [Deltaproteobacteria bacterium]